MKKKAIVIVGMALLLALSACTLQTTSNDDTMSTRVAQILTQEYTEPLAATAAPAETESATAPEPTPTVPVVVVVTLRPTAEQPTATEPAVIYTGPTPTPTEGPATTEAASQEPTAVPTPGPDVDPVQRLGTAKSTDAMDSNELWNWPLGNQEYTNINFKDGFMELKANKDVAGWRLPMAEGLTDFYAEMTVKTGACKGEDNYGIIFHVPVFNRPDQGYLFTISCDGAYRLTKWNGRAAGGGSGWRLVDWTASEYIHAGSDQTNRIGIMSKDNQFYLYANGYLLNKDLALKDNDQPWSTGHFGVFASARETKGFTIYIDSMSYWDTAFVP
jgi:hypothetical protein